jgi:hypothetical protein
MPSHNKKTLEANLYARTSIRKQFKIDAGSVEEMINQVLRLAQNLTAADFRASHEIATAGETMVRAYDGNISIDNASLRSGQRRVVFSLAAGRVHDPRLHAVQMQLPETLLEELVRTVRENSMNVLRLLDASQTT